MQSARKTKRLSILSMAIAATLGAKTAQAATLTLYYDNIHDVTDGQSYGYAQGNTDGTNYTGPLTINIAVGDTFEFGIDAVVTNNINPDAGRKTGTTGHTVVQPSYLGLSWINIKVPSSDHNASILAPMTTGGPTQSFGGLADYNDSISLNNEGGLGDSQGDNSGANPFVPVWSNNTPGDVVPGSATAGDVGDHFAIFQGNGAVSSNTPNGANTIGEYGALTATYANATDFFSQLSYTALNTGTVTLSPAVLSTETYYWMNTQTGSATVPSGYRGSTFTNPGDVIGTLPDLVIIVGRPPPPPGPLVWNNTGGTGDGQTWDLSNNQNWNNGIVVTDYTDATNVIFNDTNNGNYAVNLNTTVSPSSVVVDNSAGNYTISGSGKIAGTGSLTKTGTSTLTLSTVNTYTGGTTVNAGTLIAGVNGAVPASNISITGGTLQLAANTGLFQVPSTALSITGNGALDITNNQAIITYGASDPISTIAAYIKSGFNGGAWNGPGIISSAARSPTSGLHYGIGYADGNDYVVYGLPSGQIELKYTLLGDANLDGVVDGEDFTILVSNLGKSVSTSGGIAGSGWDKGDFDYDGVVTGNDWTALVANIGKSDSGADVALPASDYAAIDAFAAANGLMADVPEPATGSMLLMTAAAILTRRRRPISACDTR
jgi:autotransporter-associated beta strand protein